MREKTFKNTPKGRSEIPNRSGEYDLLDNRGKIVRTARTNNLSRAIKEQHYIMTTKFSYIKIRYGKGVYNKNE